MDFLYTGRNIRVYFRKANVSASDRIVVCFHGRIAKPEFLSGNFGESFLLRRGYDAIHFQTDVNNWYQSPDIEKAIAAARGIIRSYPHCATYGSSMGGYAAVAFSGLLGADTVAAFVPQASPLPEKTRFERRWMDERAAIVPIMDDLSGQISQTAKIYVAFDPFHLSDRLHANMIRNAAPATSFLHFPLVDHDVLRFIAEAGLQNQIPIDCINGTMDPRAYRNIVRSKRKLSGTYLFFAGLYARRRKKLALSWKYWLRAMDLSSSQLDYYRRILKTNPDPATMEQIQAIVSRRMENTSLVTAFSDYKAQHAKTNP